MNNKYIIDENVETHIIKKEELDILIQFQKEIIDNMEKKEWFVPLTKEEFLTSINGDGDSYFFKYKDEIIGVLVLTCNAPEVLSEYKLKSNNYMLIDSIMVKKEYRGNKLQKQMLKYAQQKAKELKMDGLVATVHPDNIYSLYNFDIENYELAHVLTIHNGTRNIMVKNI